MILKEVAQQERPREKAYREGVDKLSHCELIALILRTGSKDESVLILAQKVLNLCGGLQGLTEISYAQLIALKGIKKVKAIELLASVELAKRMLMVSKELLTVRHAEDIFQYYRNRFIFEKQEKFMVLFLDTKHQILKEKVLFMGGLNMSLVHPREIFKEALACNSAKIVCIHNHPSGQCDPSIEDMQVTQLIQQAGKVMGIELLDHIIFGWENYYSFAQHQEI